MKNISQFLLDFFQSVPILTASPQDMWQVATQQGYQISFSFRGSVKCSAGSCCSRLNLILSPLSVHVPAQVRNWKLPKYCRWLVTFGRWRWGNACGVNCLSRLIAGHVFWFEPLRAVNLGHRKRKRQCQRRTDVRTSGRRKPEDPEISWKFAGLLQTRQTDK